MDCFRRTVLLIDALDECKDVHERCALAAFLRDSANAVPWIRVVIAGRREPDIDKVLGSQCTSTGIRHVDVNDRKWGADADIRTYVKAKSGEMDLKLSINQIDLLVDKASGLFVWCAIVF